MVSGSAGGASVGGVVSAGNVVADASIDAAVEPDVDEGLELHAIKLMDNTAMAQRDFMWVTVVGVSAVALHGADNAARVRQFRDRLEAATPQRLESATACLRASIIDRSSATPVPAMSNAVP